MDVANTVITTVVTIAVGGSVVWAMRGKFAALERELDVRFGAVDRRFDAVDQRFEAVDRRFEGVDQRLDAVDRRFERIEASLDGLRSDLTQVALAVGARPRAQNG
jgi:hypothetical protein